MFGGAFLVLALVAGAGLADYTLVENFTDPAWRGAPIWSGDAYEMVNGTHGWTVVSAQSGLSGRAYVNANQTSFAGAISATKGKNAPSSISHALNMTSGSVSFSWADGYGYSSIRLQLFGPADTLVADVNFGNQSQMFMTVNGTVFLVNGSSGMTASYAVPGNITVFFDCGTGSITANANNDGVNFAAGKSAGFLAPAAAIRKVVLMADDDGVSSSEINLTAAGITITGIGAPPVEESGVLFQATFETNVVTGGNYPDASGGDVYIARGWRGSGENRQGWYAEPYFAMAASGNENNHLAAVSTNRPHSGSQSMRKRKEGYFYNFVRHGFDTKTNGTITVTFYYWFDSASTANVNDLNNIFVMVDDYSSRQTAGQPWANYVFGEFYTPYHTVHFPYVPNTLFYPSGAGYNNILSVSGIGGQDRWIGLRLVFDMNRDMLSILTDEDDNGSFVAGVTDAPFYEAGNAGSALSCVSFYELCGTPNYFWNDAYDIYIDDITVRWDRPPGSGTLIMIQ